MEATRGVWVYPRTGRVTQSNPLKVGNMGQLRVTKSALVFLCDPWGGVTEKFTVFDVGSARQASVGDE